MKIRYSSKIDWWIWAVILFTLSVHVVLFAVFYDVAVICKWVIAVSGFLMLACEVVAVLGVWYEIDCGELLVYNMFRQKRYPIDKITEVKLVSGMLSAPALSTCRVAMRFSDRGILGSYMPLEVSPKDRSAFIRDLLCVNSAIKVGGKMG